MDHQRIEEENIPDRYVLGHLTLTERTRFEAHFIECPECLDRIQAAQNFKEGLRALAASEVLTGTDASADTSGGPLYNSRGRWRMIALAAYAALVAVFAALLSLRGQLSDIRSGLAAATAAQAALRAQHSRDMSELRNSLRAQSESAPMKSVAIAPRTLPRDTPNSH